MRLMESLQFIIHQFFSFFKKEGKSYFEVFHESWLDSYLRSWSLFLTLISLVFVRFPIASYSGSGEGDLSSSSPPTKVSASPLINRRFISLSSAWIREQHVEVAQKAYTHLGRSLGQKCSGSFYYFSTKWIMKSFPACNFGLWSHKYMASRLLCWRLELPSIRSATLSLFKYD